MKVGIIGSGFVGATAAYAIMMRKSASDIILVDINEKRSIAEAQNIMHAVPFAEPVDVYAGTYQDLKDSKVIVIAAGASQKPGETRLELMERNASIMKDIISKIAEVNQKAILLVATNPVDIITHICAQIANDYGIPSSRVIGTGTTLGTARFRTLLGNYIGVDPQHVHTYVIGEHRDSEVLCWSNIDIGGVTFDDFIAHRNIEFNENIKKSIDDSVRFAAYKIIEGKGSTYYGIGGSIAKLVDVINRDNRAVLTVSVLTDDVEGVKNVTLSLPHLIGGEGDLGSLPLRINVQERKLLRRSAEIIKNKIDEYENKINS